MKLTIRPARPEDVPLLMELLMELATYERLAHEVHATPELMHEGLFGSTPAAEALIAECDDEPAGYALFYTTFSTFLAVSGVWLEDVFVRPAHRRHGIGRLLLAAVAARTRERGGERLEWAALRWNELALDFYRGLGARQMDEWITHRLVGTELAALASESPPAADAAGRTDGARL